MRRVSIVLDPSICASRCTSIPRNTIIGGLFLVVSLIVAYGFAMHQGAYLLDPWCQLDFVVVCLAWLPILFPSMSSFNVLRAQKQPEPSGTGEGGEKVGTVYHFYEIYKDEGCMAAHKETAHYKAWADFKAAGGVESQRVIKVRRTTRRSYYTPPSSLDITRYHPSSLISIALYHTTYHIKQATAIDFTS